MHCHRAILALTIVVLTSDFSWASFGDPTPPVWPNAFQVTFNETSTLPVVGTSSSITGTYYFDYEKQSERIDRNTGKFDRYCSSVKYFEDTPCTHLVLQGLRYLVFPSLTYCCACCTSEKGCGMLRPDWLVNATFIGYNTTTSVKYQVWDIKGLQDNFYWQVDSTQVPYIIDQQPNDKMVFNVDTYKKGPVDPSIFNLPSYCSKDHKCPTLSICTVAR